MNITKIMPPTWLWIAILLMIGFHFIYPGVKIIPPLWNLGGLLPIVVGVITNLMADRAFHKAKTTVKPFVRSTFLIKDGVFRISRHPMYLGFALILLGVALLLRSLTPYMVIIAFVIFIDRTYIRTEEKMMAEDFGDEWEAYKRGTRKWF